MSSEEPKDPVAGEAAAPVGESGASAPQPRKGGGKKGDGGGGKKGGGKKGGKKGGGGKVSLDSFKVPEYALHRCAVWDRLRDEQQAEFERRKAEANGAAISITLPDGSVKEGVAFETSPMNIAEGISQGLAQKCVVARVKVGENESLWDMNRPLEASCELHLCTFDSDEGRHVFWHSSAHVLGQALEKRFGGQLCIGPPVEKPGGFYYDMAMPEKESAGEQGAEEGAGEKEKVAVVEEDLAVLEQLVSRIQKEKQPFERLVLKKEDALEMFKYNKYKQEIISKKVPDGDVCTAYRCGPLIDLCRGPHVPHTGKIKSFKVTQASSAYWLGKADNDSLQRVYGVSFPDNKQMKAHMERLKEMKERDHRNIGKIQELFFFEKASPGSCFWLPHGARIYNKLMAFIRNEYHERGYSEVITPNMYTSEFLSISGHWQNYKDDMFVLESEKQQFALKPMNCPGHCVMFGHRSRSHRELPIRFADFGVLHRNELSGALTGLTRVRRFQQDDAHIFCRHDQLASEIRGALDFMKHVYGVFGFTFDLELSTRPEEKYLGDIAVWDQAEKALEEVLDASGFPWKLNPGDGAFYGPKIDIHITDALGRSHQCATVQLDFQLPIRFKLEYVNEEGGKSRPVIIHRAMYGSLERFMAILIEHTGGKCATGLYAPPLTARRPLWLSPRQVLLVPVAPAHYEYAEKVARRLHDAGFFVEAELSGLSFNKKLMVAREAKLFNYVLVVGDAEMADDAVNVRTRENDVLGAQSCDAFIERLQQEVREHR